MKDVKEKPSVDLCLICYPYFPSKDTGRGHDRYIFELKQNIDKACSGVNVRVLHQGLSRGVFAAGMKQFKFIFDLLFTRAAMYHAISPMAGATATLLGKSPLIVTIHDLIPFHVSGYDFSWKHWYIRLCTRISVLRSSAVIVPYKVTKDEIISRFKVPEEKIYVVNYGVDHSFYYPRKNAVTAKVLYIGEVSRSKGVDALIRAFCVVKQEVVDAALVIGGKYSRDQPFLEKMSKEIGARDVIFSGYVPEDELPRHYSSATVMIFPSRYGFGLSTLEAMACGTPVVVGASLDAPEFVADAGILVDPDDINGMAKNIIRVLTEPGLREKLSEKAIERAKEFSWEKMARKTVELYNDLLVKTDR
jgi:glycosyltransferase involved in cell wall biosynthesis